MVLRPVLLAAGATMLAACSMLGQSQQQTPAPQPPPQSSPYNNDLHHNYPGPGTTAPNSD